MKQTIAILGWGSLLWDGGPEFDDQHGPWQLDGPTLPLEFTRISKTRGGALTLVIDVAYGEPCQVAFAMSKRANLREARRDLQSREGTNLKNTGVLPADEEAPSETHASIVEAIGNWARMKELDVVVWTALPRTFQAICGSSFSVHAALTHLQALTPEAKNGAAEYIQRAPTFIDTPLRRHIQAHPTFRVLS